MTRDERRHVQAMHDATTKLLAAKDPAELYIARLAFGDALEAMVEWITDAERIRNSAAFG